MQGVAACGCGNMCEQLKIATLQAMELKKIGVLTRFVGGRFCFSNS